MEQAEFFYDSAEEATNAAMVKSGMAPKRIAGALWPHLKPDTAYARLKSALNPDKPEKLTMDEIMHLCRITERYDPLYYMADELSHSRPQFRAPEDRDADLAHEAARLSTQVQRLMRQVERLGGVRLEAVR